MEVWILYCERTEQSSCFRYLVWFPESGWKRASLGCRLWSRMISQLKSEIYWEGKICLVLHTKVNHVHTGPRTDLVKTRKAINSWCASRSGNAICGPTTYILFPQSEAFKCFNLNFDCVLDYTTKTNVVFVRLSLRKFTLGKSTVTMTTSSSIISSERPWSDPSQSFCPGRCCSDWMCLTSGVICKVTVNSLTWKQERARLGKAGNCFAGQFDCEAILSSQWALNDSKLQKKELCWYLFVRTHLLEENVSL